MARRYHGILCWSSKNTISSETLFLPREHKIRISEPPCNGLFIMMTNCDGVLTILQRCLTTFRRLPKILQNCSEDQTNVPEHFPKIFQKFSKTAEDCRKLSRKTRNCFDHTPTNLSTNLRDKLDISASSTSSLSSEDMENASPDSRM